MGNIFLSDLCFVPCPNTQEKFQLQNDKNERKWVQRGFQNDKIDL